MVITIARECGCDGDEVGERLSEKYSIPCYAKAELIRLAKKKDIYDKYPFFFGELPVDVMMNSMAEDFQMRLYKTPKEALAKLLGEQSCVVIGRASDYAFKGRKDAVRIFLCGDKDKRVQRIAQKHGITERKAQAVVEQTDQRRSGYHNYYSGEQWGYAGNYDLCLNKSRLGIDGVVDMIAAYIKTVGIKK